jgi:hypothetical protein
MVDCWHIWVDKSENTHDEVGHRLLGLGRHLVVHNFGAEHQHFHQGVVELAAELVDSHFPTGHFCLVPGMRNVGSEAHHHRLPNIV